MQFAAQVAVIGTVAGAGGHHFGGVLGRRGHRGADHPGAAGQLVGGRRIGARHLQQAQIRRPDLVTDAPQPAQVAARNGPAQVALFAVGFMQIARRLTAGKAGGAPEYDVVLTCILSGHFEQSPVSISLLCGSCCRVYTVYETEEARHASFSYAD